MHKEDIFNQGITRSFTLYNYTAMLTGFIYGLTLPDSTPIYSIIVSGAVGLVLSKHNQ